MRTPAWDADDTTGAEVGDPDRTAVGERDDLGCPSVQSDDGYFCTANEQHRGPHVAGSELHGTVLAVWE